MATMKKLKTGETLHAWTYGDAEDEGCSFSGIALGIFDKSEHETEPCMWINSTSVGEKQIVIDPALAKAQGFDIIVQEGFFVHG